ncbi:MAG: AAA family ATPase, partial [Allobaculum sp.]|nr:AAA family ATPase [Allobaculum sp.]
GLVAGTTGSGKSEFLQALILSLASHYSPNEIGFVLIDFKGGDMARPFTAKKERSALPHLSATISNLSGNILQRALISLQAEINKREDLFNQTAKEIGIDKIDINSYHRYFKEGRIKEPLPHLVIVIDEFAQLKTKNEEFLDQLKDIAQVGRSLGIHLILATQKPDGIVDPQILSNSRFRICLKVAQRDDSMAVINRPDAARIKTPGRFYLQVGFDELFEQIQAGYTGSLYRPTPQFISEEELTLQVIDDTATPIYQAKLNLTTETSEVTEMERIVNAMSTLGDRLNLKVKPLWMDLLKERIDLAQVPVNQKGLATASIGLVDLINTQEQRPWQHDFIKDGSLILYGQPRSGKTTAIQNILYSMIVIEKFKPS